MANGFPEYLLNGLIPINTGTPDPYGSYWWLDGDVIGWDSPDSRVTMVPKMGADPNADGEYASDLHYRGRSIAMSLFCGASSRVALEQSLYYLKGALDLIDSSGTFLGDEPSGAKELTIFRSGNQTYGKIVTKDQAFPRLEASQLPNLPLGSIVYLSQNMIEVYAPDPRKYATSSVTLPVTGGSSGSHVNPGNTATQRAVITYQIGGVLGPTSNPHIEITSPGYSASLGLRIPTVPDGGPALPTWPTTLFLDLQGCTMKGGDGQSYYFLRDMQTPWLQIPPGPFTVLFTGLPTEGSLTYYPAWI